VATGVRLYWEEHGQGEPIIMVPAGTRTHKVYQQFQAPALAQRYRVILFDQRGIGESEGPKTKYTIQQLSADLVALLDELGIKRAHVLGHSIGGRVALQTALTWPGRVRSLILCATGAGGGASFRGVLSVSTIERLLADAAKGLPQRDWGEEGYGHWFSPGFLREHQADVKAWEPFLANGHHDAGILLRYFQTRQLWDVSDSLGDVQVPTLVIVGTDDRASGHIETSRDLAQRIPGATLREIEGCRHGFFYERPEESNRILLEWLDQQAGKEG
jgi:pimeloyl-ACP methyl ester carboxylesterase